MQKLRHLRWGGFGTSSPLFCPNITTEMLVRIILADSGWTRNCWVGGFLRVKFSDQNFAFALNASVVIGYGALLGVESLDECERSAGPFANPMDRMRYQSLEVCEVTNCRGDTWGRWKNIL